jgi:cell division protein FtsN
MKLKCPRCGSANELEETNDAGAHRCALCGAGVSADARVRRTGVYDGYAVGRRVLKFVPAWLLICVACFVVVLFLFKWAARPVGNAGAREDEFRNEATNRPPPPTPTPSDSHTNAKPSDRPREDVGREPGEPSEGETGDAAATEAGAQRVGDARGVNEAEETASYSVQAGAFDDRSQANELVSRLRASGFDARVVAAEDSRRFRFQVRSGLFQTREEAARLVAQLRPKGFGQTVIIEPARP